MRTKKIRTGHAKGSVIKSTDLPAVRGQRLSQRVSVNLVPALTLPPGLAPVPGFVVVVRTAAAVHLGLPGTTTVPIGAFFIAVHCPGARHVLQDFMVFAVGWR